MKSLVQYLRYSLLQLCHMAIIAFSLAGAFWLRFDLAPGLTEKSMFMHGLWLGLPIKGVAFLYARVYRGWLRLAGVADLLRLFLGNVAASLLFAGATLVVIGQSWPRSVFIIDFLICFLIMGGMRFVVRILVEGIPETFSRKGLKGCLIYGAGPTGRVLLKELHSNRALGYRVVGFLDDDPNNRYADYMGVRVLGVGRDAARIVDRLKNHAPRVEEVIIALPSATGHQLKEALANCRAAGLTCKTIPGIRDLLNGDVLSSQMRTISPHDLLARDQVQLEEGRVQQSIVGQIVLVTGAAGSIGSELSHQIARFQPQRLILFDQAESDLFRIDREVRGAFPRLDVVPEIGDIRDSGRVLETMQRHGVTLLFHAAAYKHVPLMEGQIIEAVRNNVLGTWNLVKAAKLCRVSKFLMISTDKAVNPSSIMGLTKRVAELIVASMQETQESSPTRFVSVRFGNVLGSNGSVVPLFQEQISAGGPITITHPEVRRYFMTIPEAVQLVLQASTMGKGSEIFVLDMGKPVRILDLALNMIRLAGLEPYEDIEIRFVGLRPGEKLYEEIMTEGENIVPTYHKKIRIFRGACPSRRFTEAWIAQLESLLAARNEALVLSHLQELVPEYRAFVTPAGPGLRNLVAASASATVNA